MRRRIPCTTSAPNESRRAEFSLPGIAAVTNAQIRLGRGGARYRDHVAVCTYVGYILCRRPIASGALASRDQAADIRGPLVSAADRCCLTIRSSFECGLTKPRNKALDSLPCSCSESRKRKKECSREKRVRRRAVYSV